MAFPNLIAILALNGVVVKETRDYFRRLDAGEVDEGLLSFKAKREAAQKDA